MQQLFSLVINRDCETILHLKKWRGISIGPKCKKFYELLKRKKLKKLAKCF